MKKLISIFAATFVCFVFFSDAVMAQKKQSPQNNEVEVLANIAVLDMIAVRRDAKAFKGLRKQINTYREQLKKDARLEDSDLQKANRELARQRAIMTPDAFRDERKKFETRVGKAQQNLQSRWRTLKDVERDAEGKILNALQKATVEVAQKKKLILIFRKSAIIFWVESLEVTNDVIAILDKRLPNVKTTPPKGFLSTSAKQNSSSKKK